MKHPVLNNWSSTSIYACAWVIVMFFHTYVIHVLHQISWIHGLVDAIIFIGIYALLSLAFWFIVYYSRFESKTFLNLLLNHIATGVLAIVCWFSIATNIAKWIIHDLSYQDFLQDFFSQRILEGAFLYVVVTMLYYVYMYYHRFKINALREANLKTMLRESELNALKAQIHPHFLFNSLNSIGSLTLISPEKAHAMVIKLSDFMRYSLSTGSDELSTLGDELDNADKYLDIEKTRYGDKLQILKKVDKAALKHKLPKLIMQPLLENAIKYGVYENIEGSEISIEVILQNEHVHIEICNGFDPKAGAGKGKGIGLKNIRERLKINYRNNAHLQIDQSNNNFKVLLKIPINH